MGNLKITNLYGMSSASTALLAQNMVARHAKQLGFEELGIYFYDAKSDTPEMLSARIDGILASLQHEDIFVFQFPSWNGYLFDEALLSKLSLYHSIKKIIFVHDIVAFMWEENAYLIDRIISQLNQADVLILPSKQMYQCLQAHGLSVEKVIFQQIWDTASSFQPKQTPFVKQMFFLGNLEKFTFIRQRDFQYPIHCFSTPVSTPILAKNVIQYDYLPEECLLETLNSMGGFGLVWSEEIYWQKYLQVSNPYKLATYLAANLPVIVPSYLSSASFVEQNHLGIVVDRLEEAEEYIHNLSEEAYNSLVKSVYSFGFLIRNGYFTKKVLIDAIHSLHRIV